MVYKSSKSFLCEGGHREGYEGCRLIGFEVPSGLHSPYNL